MDSFVVLPVVVSVVGEDMDSFVVLPVVVSVVGEGTVTPNGTLSKKINNTVYLLEDSVL